MKDQTSKKRPRHKTIRKTQRHRNLVSRSFSSSKMMKMMINYKSRSGLLITLAATVTLKSLAQQSQNTECLRCQKQNTKKSNQRQSKRA